MMNCGTNRFHSCLTGQLMPIFRSLLTAFFLSLACLPMQAQDAAESIRVMSFNIRYGKANDGDNHWSLRKELVSKTVIAFAPDLLGTQETLEFQAQFLRESLPDYSYVGRSREANEGGEQCGVFFRNERFTKLAEGHFWLSKTPNHPGSKSWDSSLPRMASWVKLWDLKAKRAIVFVNTHFDHRGEQARLESAKLIARQILDLADGLPVVLTGDFNTAESSEPYQALFETENGKSMLVDSFRVKNPNVTNQTGTFNGFTGKLDGARIDWIGVTRGFGILEADIDRTNEGGRWPSDHCPVTTVIGYGKR